MRFFIKDFFSKCDQIRRKLRIWSHLLKKSLMENFIFCAAPQQSNDIDCGVYLCVNIYKLLHYLDEIKQNLSYSQDENLSVRYWIACMCIKNKEVLMTTKFNEADKNKILVKLDYENFYKILL